MDIIYVNLLFGGKIFFRRSYLPCFHISNRISYGEFFFFESEIRLLSDKRFASQLYIDYISTIFKFDLFLYVIQLFNHLSDDLETFCIINIKIRNNEIQ